MAQRPRPKLADYATLGLAPSLIFIMISSLANFFVMLFYEGDYGDRIWYLIAMYTMGSVSLARLVIEFDRSYSAGYALALGAAMLFVMTRFVGNPVFCLGVVLLIGYLSDRIVHDCTVIDDGVDASGEGLIDRHLDEASGLSNADDEAPETEKAKRRRKSHQPGRTVFLLSLAALPLFGLGQFMIGGQPQVWARAQLMLGLYLFSSLSLLVTTSFLNLRRYLRQRDTDMPVNVTIAWLIGGILMVIALLLMAYLAPLPGSAIANIEVPKFLQTDETTASDWGWGGEGADRSDGENNAETSSDDQAADKQKKGAGQNQNEASGQTGGQKPSDKTSSSGSKESQSGDSSQSTSQQSGDSRSSQDSDSRSQSNGESPDESAQSKSQSQNQQSQNQQSQNQQSQNQQSQNQQSQNQQSQNEQPQNQQPQNQQPQNQQPQNQQSQNQSSESEQSASKPSDSESQTDSSQQPPSGDESQQPASSEEEQRSSGNDEPTNSEESEKQPSESEPESGEEDAASQDQDSSSQPQSSEPDSSSGSSGNLLRSLSSLVSSLGTLLRFLLIAALVVIVAVYLYRMRDAIAAWWRSLFERGNAPEAANELATPQDLAPPPKPFAAFRNPIGVESDPRRIIIVTFHAYEAWTRERGLARARDETPASFVERIRGIGHRRAAVAPLILPVESECVRIGNAYDRIVYGRGGASRRDLEAAAQLWRHMNTPVAVATA